MEVKTSAELLKMYDKVSPFFEEKAQACKNNRWFHIHTDGSLLYEKTYDWVGRFCGGVARAQDGVVEILINIDGEQTFL